MSQFIINAALIFICLIAESCYFIKSFKYNSPPITISHCALMLTCAVGVTAQLYQAILINFITFVKFIAYTTMI